MNGTPIPAGFNFGGGTKESSNSLEVPSSGSGERERDRKAKSGRFWGAFGRQQPPAGSGATGPGPTPTTSTPGPVSSTAGRAVFGVTIEQSLTVSQIANLPAIVFRCIEYLESKKAQQEEGIYRLSGSTAVIKTLKDRFNAEGDVNLIGTDEFWDLHAIAGLLKSYFRDLPSSILTRELHMRFLAVIDLLNQEEKIDELAQLISRLPLANYSLLRALCAHLILIVQNAQVNKMTMRNVGIVFSPTLGIPAGVFSLMLGEFDQVFAVDGEGSNDNSGETTPSTQLHESQSHAQPDNRRNSRNYNDAAADRLLGLTGRKLSTSADDSDDDDMPIQEESETDTDSQSVSTSERTGSPPETPGPHTYSTANLTSHAATVAATRGLQIATDRLVPHSPGPGLPASPRPNHQTHTIHHPHPSGAPENRV
jgi:RalA-binding protein 1